MYERSVDYGVESSDINWSHARAVLWRWQQVLRECCVALILTISDFDVHVSANHRCSSERFLAILDAGPRFLGRQCPARNIGPVWLCHGRESFSVTAVIQLIDREW